MTISTQSSLRGTYCEKLRTKRKECGGGDGKGSSFMTKITGGGPPQEDTLQDAILLGDKVAI